MIKVDWTHSNPALHISDHIHWLLKVVLLMSLLINLWVKKCFFYFIFFLGGPIGGIWRLARALKASAMRWGWETTICFHPDVSMTSVTCRVLINSMAWNVRTLEHQFERRGRVEFLVTWAFNCSAEWRSASIKTSHTFSTVNPLHKASSHIT